MNKSINKAQASERCDINKAKTRIWELDFIRGIAIMAVVFIHTVFDINYVFDILEEKFLADSAIFNAVQSYGGIIFIVLSGICLTLGRKSIKRGLIVLSGGFLVSSIMYIMYFMKLSDSKIDFGVLSCLGLCMLCATPLLKCNKFSILAIGVLSVALGIYISALHVDSNILVFLGLKTKDYMALDYFPFILNFGYYLIGIFIGKTVYKDGKTLIKCLSDKTPVIKQVCFIGRNTLIIYIIHQPIVFGILWLFFPLK